MRLSVEAPARLPARPHPAPLPCLPLAAGASRPDGSSPRVVPPVVSLWCWVCLWLCQVPGAALQPGPSRCQGCPRCPRGRAAVQGLGGMRRGGRGLAEPARTTLSYRSPSVPAALGRAAVASSRPPNPAAPAGPFPAHGRSLRPQQPHGSTCESRARGKTPSQGQVFIWGLVPMGARGRGDLLAVA